MNAFDIDITNVAASWGGEAQGWAVLVHGGAGNAPPEPLHGHIEGCRAAAAAAAEILRSGGCALDAAQRAVEILEDDPCFNAGTGACLNSEGLIELDAAIMAGTGLRAGAVCALPPFRHPIAIARAALEDGQHVLYASDGASRFAIARGFAGVSSEALTTDAARGEWARARAQKPTTSVGGTVGAVVRDGRGGVAAATSTGGLTNKRPGRIGDAPVLGAGTYADDDAGACSATGMGESSMRIGLARTAVDAMRARVHPEEAARAAIRTMGARASGAGGVILVDRDGRLGLARNTAAMTWAALGATLPGAAGI